jgi:hypothetical protein
MAENWLKWSAMRLHQGFRQVQRGTKGLFSKKFFRVSSSPASLEGEKSIG